VQSKTSMPKKTDLEPKWHFISARGRVLGDLATEVVKVLMGKDKAFFTPGVLNHDKVVVTDAAKVVVTGRKEQKKLYIKHSNFPGGLKTFKLSEVRAKDPRRIVKEAVSGMLPINTLRKKAMTNLYIYPSSEHPHKAQQEADK